MQQLKARIFFQVSEASAEEEQRRKSVIPSDVAFKRKTIFIFVAVYQKQGVF